MTVNLTPNAIEMICNGEFQGDEVKPVVQVSDVKLLSAGQQNSSERYRMILSDGVHLQQGMLATQLNSLVHEGKLQKGSIVQLSQFVSQMIQNRKIIIIIGLNVILEKCDPIGEPKTYVQGGGTATGVPQARPSMPVQSSMDQPGNRQSYGAASLTNGPPPGPNINGRAPMQHPKADSGVSAHPYGSSFPSNSDSGRYGTTAGPPAYPKAEPGGPLAGNYSDQNRSFQNPKVEGGSRPPLNSYSRPVQPTYQQPPPMYANRGPVAKNEAPARIIPIAALNPYQGRWTIKARVTSKKELRRFNGARGEGKVFSFELLDSDGGEIQVTCFNAAAEQFYDQIEAGKVYMISRGNLKPASKTFNRLQNDFEIHLESTSSVQPCFEDDSTIPRQQFHFRPISDIESMAKDTFVDVIGVVSSINLTGTILKKDGTETMKRTLHLKDMSGRSVELTMWGNLCNAEGQQLQNICDSGIFPVLALKGGRVNEFNGKTVGTVFSTQLFIEPDFPEARRLKEWFDMEGKNTPAISISKDSTGMGKVDVRKTISQIKDERLGTSEKPDYIMVKATIAFIKLDSFCYTACPIMIGEDRKCSKKVINNGDGQWRCDRCDKSVDECDYRYNLSCQIQDHTGVTWVTAFQETAEVILGVSAKELYFLKYEEQDDDKFTDITRKALFNQYMFKLRVKEETYNDEQRVKSNVSTAEKLNFSSEARYLLEMMDKLSTEGPGADPGQAGSIANSSMNNVGYQNMGMKQASLSVMNSMGSSSTGRNFSAPANQVGQYGNQYSGGKEPAMMGTGVLLCCNSCGGTGHNAKNCPSVMSKPQVQPVGGFVNRGSSAGVGISGGGGECYKCHQIGHWARDCPGSNNIESGGGGSSGGGGGYGGGGGGGGGGGECYKCHQSGHWARDCPGSNTVSSGYGSGGGGGGGECYKCHQSGHWARDCPGSNTVSSGYGSGGVTGSRYGGVSNQRVGGF